MKLKNPIIVDELREFYPSAQKRQLEFTGNDFRIFDHEGEISGRSEIIPEILADYALHPRDGIVRELAELGFMDEVLERE